MEITEGPYHAFEIQLTEHEHKQIKQFCVISGIDLSTLTLLFYRAMYNFIVQYLMVKCKDGT